MKGIILSLIMLNGIMVNGVMPCIEYSCITLYDPNQPYAK